MLSCSVSRPLTPPTLLPFSFLPPPPLSSSSLQYILGTVQECSYSKTLEACVGRAGFGASATDVLPPGYEGPEDGDHGSLQCRLDSCCGARGCVLAEDGPDCEGGREDCGRGDDDVVACAYVDETEDCRGLTRAESDEYKRAASSDDDVWTGPDGGAVAGTVQAKGAVGVALAAMAFMAAV